MIDYVNHFNVDASDRVSRPVDSGAISVCCPPFPPNHTVILSPHVFYGQLSITQATMPSARDRLAELRALRAAGKKRLSTYEVEDQDDIYDEVDDASYKKVIRDRLDQDDFVVDDNGAGYADDGREVWNERTVEYDSDDSDELPTHGKAAKRKREEEKQRKEKINKGISKYFNSGNATAAAPKPKVGVVPSARCSHGVPF